MLLAAVAAAVVVSTGASAATEGGVTPACSPGDCGGTSWVNSDVTITWTWSNPGASPGTPASGQCGSQTSPTTSSQTVSTEGDQTISCEIDYASAADSPCSDTACTGSAHIKIDETPPSLSSATPTRPPDHGGWYNHALTVAFHWSDALSGLGTCTTSVPYSGRDGAGRTVPAGCSDTAGNDAPTRSSSPFNYDATPPTVTGATADRPPDHDGWYTHPVTFTFHGSDATSGIASCATVTYSGPDDGGASVTAGCSDVAGNSARKKIAFRYKATPPAPSKLFAVPGNKKLALNWAPPSDAASFVLVRTRAVAGATSRTVYRGSGHDFVDRGLRNGKKYNYTLTTLDAAGNSSVSTISAVPDGSTLRPFLDTAVTKPPLLSWKHVRRTLYYNVQLYRGRTKLLSTWPTSSRLQLHSKWRYNGHHYRLTPGLYRWYVWPGIGAKSRHRYAPVLGSSTFRVVR